MNLTFKKVGDIYEATFTAEGDFSLHIEREQAGEIDMYQTSVEGTTPVIVKPQGWGFRSDLVIDVDVQGFKAPKYITIKSKTQPTMAVVVE